MRDRVGSRHPWLTTAIVSALVVGCSGATSTTSTTEATARSSPSVRATEGPTPGPVTRWGPGGLDFAPDGALYTTDCGFARIFKVSPSARISVFAGAGPGGFGNGFSGDGGPAQAAHFGCPQGIAFDAKGDLYFSDHLNQRIRMIDTDGTITTVAGNGDSSFAAGSLPALQASFSAPSCIEFDARGNLYICDRDNNAIRELHTDGTVTTVAGTGYGGSSGDGAAATSAQIDGPNGIAFDRQGNLYFSDSNNNRVRMIDTGGVISTVAGNGKRGVSGDGGPATSAAVGDPISLAFDRDGDLFLTQPDDNVVRMVTPDGIISTVAGTGRAGFSGDGGPAVDAKLGSLNEIVFDAKGDLYLVDGERIRVIDRHGTIATFAAVKT